MLSRSKMMEYLRKTIRLKDLRADVLDTNLKRCLSTLDVAFLGIGNMLGSGRCFGVLLLNQSMIPHQSFVHTLYLVKRRTSDLVHGHFPSRSIPGIYVVSPDLARRTVGPALVISYLLAGITSLFAALAYAEFGVRYPRAGSAYSYTYFSVGELLAFFVGWNVIMENVLSLAAIGEPLTEYCSKHCKRSISTLEIGRIPSSRSSPS